MKESFKGPFYDKHRKNTWYAVQADTDDDWSYGSCNYVDALFKAAKVAAQNGGRAIICYIDDDCNYCYAEEEYIIPDMMKEEE